MPDETPGALGSPASAQAPANSLPEKSASSGFPLNSSADVAAALARSLASLQTQSPTPAAETPAPTVTGEEPPPETATDQQQEEPESTLSEPAAADPESGNDGEDEADPGRKPGWQKRIDKLTAQKSELEARLASLEAKLAEPKPEPEEAPAAAQPAATPGANPLSHITNPAKLAEQRQQAEVVIEWADTALINIEADAETVMNEVAPNAKALGLPEDRESWTPGLVKRALMQVRKQAETTARKHVPAQAAFLIERQKAEQAAAAEFPWWKDAKSPERQQVANTLAQWGHLRLADIPGVPFALAQMVEGYKARMAARQAGEPAKPQALPPRTPKRPMSAPNRVPAEQAHTDQLRQRLSSAPKSEDLTQLLSLQLQQSLAPQTG